jgi:hypothetical protein
VNIGIILKIEDCDRESYFGKCKIYEACTTGTHVGMITAEGIATVRKVITSV